MKTLLIFLLLIVCFQGRSQINGKWHTAFTVAGSSHRVDLEITGIGRDANVLISFPDIPQMKTTELEDYSVFNDSIYFKWDKIGLRYQGHYYAKGDSIHGIMQQSGLEWNATFHRGEQVKKILSRPQEPRAPFDYDIQEITLKNGENTIGATLTLPHAKTNFPIVVLSSGSGPQNRDCEIMGHKPFWIIADYLAKSGIGVLRFDDRGTGKSSGNFSKTDLKGFASDVETCFNYLEKQYKQHPIGLCGHSEGGMHTLMVAARNKKVDFLIQLAAVGTNGIEVLVEQQYLIPLKSGNDEKAAKANSLIYDSLTTMLQKSPKEQFSKNVNDFVSRNFELFPEEVKSKASANEIAASYVAFLDNDWARQFIVFQAPDYLHQIKCPILVLNGSEDIQVPPIKNQESFKQNISTVSQPHSLVKIIPGVNHLFQTCKKCTVLEYGELEETFSVTALQEIVNWLKQF